MDRLAGLGQSAEERVNGQYGLGAKSTMPVKRGCSPVKRPLPVEEVSGHGLGEMNALESTTARRLTCGSLFSGVGGFDLGFVRAGFDVRWQCEIDRDCCDVLRKQFPETDVIYSNILTMPTHQVERVDVLIGGFPCQDVSVAGRRAGLDGSRSGLFFEFARVIGELRPTFVVMENVPGLLSSNGGRDMAVILGTLRDLGAHDIAWCVLDAQWFGVPQRRRRVFLIADFAGERASQILALPEGLQGHPAPRREAREAVAASLTSGSHPNSNRPGRHREDDVILVGTFGYRRSDEYAEGDAGSTLAARDSRGPQDLITHALTGVEPDASEDGTGRGTPIIAVRTAQTSSNGWGINEEETSYTLDGAQGQAVAFAQNQRGERHTSAIAPQLTTGGGKPGEGYSAVAFRQRTRPDGRNLELAGDVAFSLLSGGGGDNSGQHVYAAMGVRRLTPTECERLMSWPDSWTALGASGKEMSDSTRYRMCGNGVVSNVAEWIARRIREVRDV